MSLSKDGIYEKGVIDPGFPAKTPTQPFWFTHNSKISKLQSTWHDSADIVIIGSGLTAASLCYELLVKRGTNLKIVVVEARDLCSGATGRNAGHIKPFSPGVWYDRKKVFGPEEAVKIMEYEHGHLDELAKCAKENKIECDLDILEGLDVYFDEKALRDAQKAVEDMRRYSPALADRYTFYDSPDSLRARNCPRDCIGAVGMRAGSMWPYKFVSGLFEKFVEEKGLLIQTNTVVTSITDRDNEEFATVTTTRGDIKAAHVIHANNAWIGHLVPELRPFVSPVRANAQRWMPKEPAERRKNSWWIRYGEKDYDAIIHRKDGSYILGRANTGRRATADDTAVDLLPQKHLGAVTPVVFDFGANMDKTHGWSGIVAFTHDGNPFVGRLPFHNRTHQWVCASYHATGMIRAFKSAQLLAHLFFGEDVPEAYPRSMLLTDARVASWRGEITSKL
ncbi:FAD dependent oxidoreductase [Fusarium falciforme]|uniref:FAD dependent oxidoreductase n=1 Tax=Fusarium falciforme TaxID=195108 RepID=UPI002300DC9F|nr:FAD dependent oxidoreductase [Fusarium falciforme]WAO94392.1 FAD dependent oxidoreductase [Fusarium falciforme]